MLSTEQYYLTKLAEEASEVAQIALKASQFGFEEVKPGQSKTNWERIKDELNDLNAILDLINEKCAFKYTPLGSAIQRKKEKVANYKKYSEELGYVCSTSTRF